MSLELSIDSSPQKLVATSWHGVGGSKGISIGNIIIGEQDFKHLIIYWLTNTDLIKNEQGKTEDIRTELVDLIKNKLSIVKGFNEALQRYEVDDE